MVIDEVDRIVAVLAARATVAAYREHGPIPSAYFADAAHQLRWSVGELLMLGYDTHAQSALTLADRLDHLAELAALLRLRTAA
jgi:hypothetical protein